jgi:hypothetical protein
MTKNYYLIEYLKQSPPIIQVVWIISAVFVLFIIPLIIYLNYLRGHLRKNEKVVAKYQADYEQALVTYLYSGNGDDEISSDQQLIIDELKKSITDPFKRKIVISTLQKLKNEISGEVAQSIEKLYFQTGLINYTLPKLKSKKWYTLAKGIRELRQFQVKEAHDQVANHINHPKRQVRKEMQLYMVNLFYFEGLDFLNVLKTPLSEWDQIQLLEVLQRFDNQKIPNIKAWLKSSNDSVVVFSLKLAKIYNQFEQKDVLMGMLDHKNKDIVIEVIFVLCHLEVFEAKEILKHNFEQRSLEEQIAIFKLLENLYELDDEPFLLDYLYHENFEIKVSALKILKSINSYKFNFLKSSSSEHEFLQIANFIENN